MIKVNPFDLHVPTDASLSQLGAAMDVLVKLTSWELGELYNRVLGAGDYPLGPGWLDRLAGERRDNLRLHDPSFVFAEPEFHSESVTWRALPTRTPQLLGQLTRARRTRNYWEHQAVDQNLNRFGEAVLRYRELAESIDLPLVVTACDRLTVEVKALRSRGGKPAPASPAADQAAELQARLEEAEQSVQEARRELADSQKEQERLEGAQEKRQKELERVVEVKEDQLTQAQADLTQVREQLQLLLQEVRLNATGEPEGLEPGDPWESGLGTRVLLLKPRMRDLIDPEQRVLMSDELGPVAQDAAMRWLELMPNGGQVYLTPGGHAAIQQGHSFVYLGQLDAAIKAAEDESTPGVVVRPPDAEPGTSGSKSTRDRGEGFLLPHMHEVTADRKDVFQYSTERLLSSILGAADAESVAEQLCGDLAPGEQFRVSKEGVVVINRGGQYVPVSQVDRDYWFRWGELTGG